MIRETIYTDTCMLPCQANLHALQFSLRTLSCQDWTDQHGRYNLMLLYDFHTQDAARIAPSMQQLHCHATTLHMNGTRVV